MLRQLRRGNDHTPYTPLGDLIDPAVFDPVHLHTLTAAIDAHPAGGHHPAPPTEVTPQRPPWGL